MATPTYRVRELSTGSIVVERLRAAHTHWSRLRGLLGTRSLPDGDGLWLRPCRQVHMFGMRYAIDVAFLDDDLRVVETVPALAPGRVSPRVSQATSALELPSGRLAALGIGRGTRLRIDDGPGVVRSKRIEGVRRALGNVVVALMYFLFVAAHVSTGRRTGQWATLAPIVIQESLFAVFLLVRRPTIAVSARPLEWIVAMVAMLLSFMLRPTTYAGPLVTVGLPLQMVGLVAAIVAVVFLGRSVGIVPADRGIQTNGMYRMIRHPIYASYVVAYVGYVITYPTARNAMIVAATVIAMNMRAIFEERLLGRDERYREYLRRTPWRFLPYLY